MKYTYFKYLLKGFSFDGTLICLIPKAYRRQLTKDWCIQSLGMVVVFGVCMV